MLFFLMAGALTLVVVAALVRPLMRDRDEPAPADRYNAVVYRHQLDELQRDAERETLPESEIAGARLEIERRLLGAARHGQAPLAGGVRRAPVAAAFALTAFLVLGAGVIYLSVGAPMSPDHPFRRELAADGADPDSLHARMDQIVAALQEKLAAHPDDAEGWGLLARSLMRLGRAAEAVSAYQHAIAASPAPTPQLEAEYGEARIITANGQVDDQARAVFGHLHAADPTNPEARYYLALAKAQHGDTVGALADWRALVAASPKGAPWLPVVQQRIAEASGPGARAAPSTSAADVPSTRPNASGLTSGKGGGT